MKFLIFTIVMLNVLQSKPMKGTRFASSARSPIFQLLDDQSSSEFSLPRFVLLPNYRNANETISIDYKSFRKSSTLIASSEWNLSVHIDYHFFHIVANTNGNTNNHSSSSSSVEQPLHAMCFLQFSIHSVGKDAGRNASCRITLTSTRSNSSIVASCIMRIGRSPSICSVVFDIAKLNNSSSHEWVSVTAELLLVPSPITSAANALSNSSIIASSSNSAAVLINNAAFQPRNWTIMQQQSSSFGLFAIGLPLTSMKIGSNFLLPLSISEIVDLQLVRILLEYDSCLSLNNVDVVDRTQWELETSFEHSQQNGASSSDNKDSINNKSREIAILRFTSLNRQFLSSESSAPRELWPELAIANFTVTDKSKNGCGIRAGIAKVKLSSGKSEKYFNKATFQSTQQLVPVTVDPDNMVIIAFQKPANRPVHLLTSISPQNTTEIRTYFLLKSGDEYMHQPVHTIKCDYGQFSRGQASNGCSPQLFANSWVLPIRIEQWKTVVFNVFNAWQPEVWKLNLSDSELNPIEGWRSYSGGRCVVMYQRAVLQVAVRLSTLNSFGIVTYLGSSLAEPDQWIDMSSETDMSQLSSDPPNVVTLSKTHLAQIMVTVNATEVTRLGLFSRDRHLLTNARVRVNSVQWVSVVRFIGRCIADIDVQRTDSHPSAEGSFVNIETVVPKLHVGDKCHLFLGVVFTDSTRLMLDDVAASDYLLEVNGIEFQNGNVVMYRSRINVTLHESVVCTEPRTVFSGFVDLSRDGITPPLPPTTDKRVDYQWRRTSSVDESVQSAPHSTRKQTETTTITPADHRNSLAIAIYCVVGVIAMALLILLLNCLIGYNVRRHSIANIQRRLCKSKPYDGATNSRKETNPVGQLVNDEHYPPLLPPPGPIISANKQHTDWGVSSESGLGPDRSSLGSQQDAIGLSTFRVSIANGSTHPSDSSSYIHQTSPFADVILESGNANGNVGGANDIGSNNHQNNSDTNYSTDQQSSSSPPPSFDAHPYLSQSYWSGLSSPYRLVSEHGHPPTDCRIAHGNSRSPDARTNSNLR